MPLLTPVQARDRCFRDAACLPYSSPTLDVWDGIRECDADPRDGMLTLLYTGYRVPPGPRGREYSAGWCREHVWPQSRGGLQTSSPGAGTDLHNLFAADISINSARGKKHFSAGGGAVLDRSPAPGYSGATESRAGVRSWEPRDAAKGLVARAVLYMACQYAGDPLRLRLVRGVDCEDDGCLGDLTTVLEWNERFPPGPREAARNDTAERLQGNRNPFTDLPALAREIDFEQSGPRAAAPEADGRA
jgi:endonuclease I